MINVGLLSVPFRGLGGEGVTDAQGRRGPSIWLPGNELRLAFFTYEVSDDDPASHELFLLSIFY